MIALTSRLPGKSSRTSVHASAVPVTALIATTPPASSNVSSSAARASGFHATCQKWCQPPAAPFATTAASGMRTMTLEVAERETAAERRAPEGAVAAPSGAALPQPPVATPRPCSIFATIPLVGSKNCVFTFVQPPT